MSIFRRSTVTLLPLLAIALQPYLLDAAAHKFTAQQVVEHLVGLSESSDHDQPTAQRASLLVSAIRAGLRDTGQYPLDISCIHNIFVALGNNDIPGEVAYDNQTSALRSLFIERLNLLQKSVGKHNPDALRIATQIQRTFDITGFDACQAARIVAAPEGQATDEERQCATIFLAERCLSRAPNLDTASLYAAGYALACSGLVESHPATPMLKVKYQKASLLLALSNANLAVQMLATVPYIREEKLIDASEIAQRMIGEHSDTLATFAPPLPDICTLAAIENPLQFLNVHMRTDRNEPLPANHPMTRARRVSSLYKASASFTDGELPLLAPDQLVTALQPLRATAAELDAGHALTASFLTAQERFIAAIQRGEAAATTAARRLVKMLQATGNFNVPHMVNAAVDTTPERAVNRSRICYLLSDLVLYQDPLVPNHNKNYFSLSRALGFLAKTFSHPHAQAQEDRLTSMLGQQDPARTRTPCFYREGAHWIPGLDPKGSPREGGFINCLRETFPGVLPPAPTMPPLSDAEAANLERSTSQHRPHKAGQPAGATSSSAAHRTKPKAKQAPHTPPRPDAPANKSIAAAAALPSVDDIMRVLGSCQVPDAQQLRWALEAGQHYASTLCIEQTDIIKALNALKRTTQSITLLQQNLQALIDLVQENDTTALYMGSGFAHVWRATGGLSPSHSARRVLAIPEDITTHQDLSIAAQFLHHAINTRHPQIPDLLKKNNNNKTKRERINRVLTGLTSIRTVDQATGHVGTEISQWRKDIVGAFNLTHLLPSLHPVVAPVPVSKEDIAEDASQENASAVTAASSSIPVLPQAAEGIEIASWSPPIPSWNSGTTLSDLLDARRSELAGRSPESQVIPPTPEEVAATGGKWISAMQYVGIKRQPELIDCVERGDHEGMLACFTRFLSQRGLYGETALHHAIGSNQPETAQYLLACRADPNATDHDGNTPLKIAETYAPHLVHLLLSFGAQPQSHHMVAVHQNPTPLLVPLAAQAASPVSPALPLSPTAQPFSPTHLAQGAAAPSAGRGKASRFEQRPPQNGAFGNGQQSKRNKKPHTPRTAPHLTLAQFMPEAFTGKLPKTFVKG